MARQDRRSSARASRGAWRRAHGWLRERPFLRFVMLFIVLCLGSLYAIGATPWVRDTFFPWYLELNALVSARVLAALGEEARNVGTIVTAARFEVDIRRGCDAIAPSAIFAAALVAFPAPWWRKLIGLVAGVATLAVINVLRIVTLYYTGVHFPDAFETIHLDVWQPVFIVLALLLWVTWALWASPARPVEPRDGESRSKSQPSPG